jgi:uncharacterized membrane protein YwaF
MSLQAQQYWCQLLHLCPHTRVGTSYLLVFLPERVTTILYVWGVQIVYLDILNPFSGFIEKFTSRIHSKLGLPYTRNR